jgi:hypothetical protein
LLGQQALMPDTHAALPMLVHRQPSSAFAAEPENAHAPKTTAADKIINFRIANPPMKNPGELRVPL